MQDRSICRLLLLMALLLFLQAVVRLLGFAVPAAAAVVLGALLRRACPHPCVISSRQDHALRHLPATTRGGGMPTCCLVVRRRTSLLTSLLWQLWVLLLLLLLLLALLLFRESTLGLLTLLLLLWLLLWLLWLLL
jgi:hypothetical protein